jgi:SAM-dependent methyltransferase
MEIHRMDARERASHSEVAADVRQFYERYPYPRPVDSLDGYGRLWREGQRRRADHHLSWPGEPFREDRSILIAGCGTSQAAKHALRWPAAKVTGIDVSATSVRCTEELRRKHDLRNLEVHQLPVERASELGTTFDQVVCTGVLHHLPDPDAGLRALRAVLAPGGAMHLMVYAPYGRTGVYMLQDFCRRIGVRASDGGIRELVAALGSLPPGHPLGALLRDAPDFREHAALADALLHPHDRAYSVPQLLELLAREGLTFGRWVRQAHYSARCGVMARIPQASALARLPMAEQFAAVELFRGTMARHSVVAYRDDHTGAPPQVGFAGEAWRGYVPVRTPDTICVRERLPPGAAAVLINRGHAYGDLCLPIGAREKRLFEAIDGERTIAEIVGNLCPETSRAYFERLWWHDQVVFDASRVARTRDRG